MAISLKAVGSYVSGTTLSGSTLTRPGTPAAGDRYYVWLSCKPFSIAPAMPAGWTQITSYTDGAVATGAGVGSMRITCWYRDWVSGDANPTFVNQASTVVGFVAQLWQKGAAEKWATPTTVTANWPSQSTGTVNAGSATTVTDGAVVMCLMGFPAASATMTRTTASVSASPALTWNGNYVESPAAHLTTATGDDMAVDIGYRLVTTGHPSTTLSTETTLSASMTGAILWVVQGLIPPSRSACVNQAVKRAAYF